MAETDTHQMATDGPLCAHCEKRTVPRSRGTKPRKYCSRSCVQRAYELRQRQLFVAAALKMEKEREREQLRAALHAAEAREGKSREDAPTLGATSREDAGDLQEQPEAKSREVPSEGKEQQDRPKPRRVADYFAGMPSQRLF